MASSTPAAALRSTGPASTPSALRSVTPAPSATPAVDVEGLSKNLADTGSDITIAQIRSLVQCFAEPSYRSPAPSPRQPPTAEEGEKAIADSDSEAEAAANPPPPPSALRTLNKSEFVESVHSVLTNIDAKEIEMWFQRIDADDQKTVSWSDFSTFLLSRAQYQHQTDLRSTEFAGRCVPVFPPNASECHGDVITVIRQHPKTNRIFTGAADGTVRAWSYDDMSHQRFVLNTENWVTDMCFIRNETRLLVASVDRMVTVLDARSCDVVRAYEGRALLGGKGIAFANTTTEVVERKLTPANRNDRSALGLDPNRVSSVSGINFGTSARQHSDTVRKLELSVLGGLSDVPNSVCSVGSRGNDDVVAFGCRGGAIRIFTLPSLPRRVIKYDLVMRPHGTMSCNQVRWSNYLSGLVSCGDDKALHISTLDRSSDNVVRSFCERGHQRAVLGFAWSDTIKQLASYSAERVVYFWDRMQAAPTNRIASLSAPVCSVAYQEHDFQLLVHTHDNALRIFDLRTNTVVQTLTEHEIPKSYGNLTTSIYANQRIVTGTTYPVTYITRRELGTSTTEYRGHVHPCLFFAESEGATTLVSVDTDTAYTWNLNDGALRFSFSVASFRKNLLEEMRLTATCTDSSSRRLVTGFHKGAAVIWNTSNGQPLAQLNDDQFAGHAITAVHTTVRHGTTFYVVAAHTLIAVCESSSKQYSVHAREYCRIPNICGGISVITSVNENTIACGTTVGAVLFLNLLTMTVEGEPLLPPVCDPDLHRRVSHAVMLSASPHLRTSHDTDDNTDPQTLSGVRIEAMRLIAGPWPEPHLMTTYSNGQVIVWNTVWRTAATVLHVSTISGFPTAFSFYQLESQPEELLVVYGDDTGNMYVNRSRVMCEASSVKSSSSTPSARRSPAAGVDRAPTNLVVALSPNTVVIEAQNTAAVAAIHCFVMAASPSYRGLDASFEVTIAVSTLLNVEAKLFVLQVPPHCAAKGADVALQFYGVLGGMGWSNGENVVEQAAHFDTVESLTDALSPVAKAAGSPDVTAAARDAKSVHDLLMLLNRVDTSVEKSAALAMSPTPPKAALTMWSRPRRRPTLAALMPSSCDQTGSTFENPVHMPPILTPASQARVTIGRAQASPIVKAQRLYQRHASFKNVVDTTVVSSSDSESSCDGPDGLSDGEQPEDVPSRTLGPMDMSATVPTGSISAAVALPAPQLDRRQRGALSTTMTSPSPGVLAPRPALPDVPMLVLDTPAQRLARQEARLATATHDTLGRRLRDAELRLNIQHHVPTTGGGGSLTARSGRRDTTTVDWTVRATARLAPTSLSTYRSADMLLDVLQLKNPAAASRAVLPSSANTSVYGVLTRTRRE